MPVQSLFSFQEDDSGVLRIGLKCGVQGKNHHNKTGED